MEENTYTTECIIRAVAKMRRLQKAYFRHRNPTHLRQAKEAENEVDELIMKFLTNQTIAKQTKLF